MQIQEENHTHNYQKYLTEENPLQRNYRTGKREKRTTCTWAFIFSSSKHPFCLKFNKKKSAAGDKAMQIKDDLQNSKIPLTF